MYNLSRWKEKTVWTKYLFDVFNIWMWIKHWCKSFIQISTQRISKAKAKEEGNQRQQQQKPMLLSTFSAFQQSTLYIFFSVFSFSFIYPAEFYGFLSPMQGVPKQNTKKHSDDVQFPPPKNILLLRSWRELRSSSEKFTEINCKGKEKRGTATHTHKKCWNWA